jgi:hypothetical protein
MKLKSPFVLFAVILILFVSCEGDQRVPNPQPAPEPTPSEDAGYVAWMEEMRQFAFEEARGSADSNVVKADDKAAFIVLNYNVVAANFDDPTMIPTNNYSILIKPKSKTGVEKVYIQFRDEIRPPTFRKGRLDLYYKPDALSTIMEMLEDTSVVRLGWIGRYGDLWQGELIQHGIRD